MFLGNISFTFKLNQLKHTELPHEWNAKFTSLFMYISSYVKQVRFVNQARISPWGTNQYWAMRVMCLAQENSRSRWWGLRVRRAIHCATFPLNYYIVVYTLSYLHVYCKYEKRVIIWNYQIISYEWRTWANGNKPFRLEIASWLYQGYICEHFKRQKLYDIRVTLSKEVNARKNNFNTHLSTIVWF